MGSANREISVEVPPYLKEYKDGTIERTAGTQVAPPGLDSKTDVVSKDVVVVPETGVSARLYRPNFTTKTHDKLPLLIYFHGGAFCISSAADPFYHNCLNKIVAEAKVFAVSVNYRLAPEHPLPAAFEDSWAAVQWVYSHTKKDSEGEEGYESWLEDGVDFDKLFLAGDSAGATIANYIALKGLQVKIPGLILLNPYFWGKDPIGVEITDTARKQMVDKWWDFVCPSDKGNDDPLINPFVEEAPSLEGLACNRVLVIVAEKDILRDRGQLYHEKLVNGGWKGNLKFFETMGEDHVFHIFDPDCEKASILFKRLASFINQQQLSE
ncbi:hypothetical protein L6164_029053 [Bauhinia variegata]|uniref:Uncharacterized protein n=1 Tax=Bauhinia variegata TaxID=167791 RepID=A0ACB9L7T8_BAUVA|nr:hypothetical protein L6164_029053 [Bauhinia variegata]